MGGIGNYTDPERESYCRDIRREQINTKKDTEKRFMISEKDLLEIKEQAKKLCGISDFVSCLFGTDDEIVDSLDKIESSICNKIDSILQK